MKLLRKNQKKKKKQQQQQQQQRKTSQTAEACWVDELAFVPVQPHQRVEEDDDDDSLSIVSWNVLAESYCSPRSHPNLPQKYKSKVFTPLQRRKVLQNILQHELMVTTDVLCLQEVDLSEIGETLQDAGFALAVETPRGKNGGTGQRVDSCGIYIKSHCWKLLKHEIISLDDLASLPSAADQHAQSDVTTNDNNASLDADDDNPSSPYSKSSSTNVQGIQSAFLRRNMALLVRLQHVRTGRIVVVANAHLYWHPGYEYVKVSAILCCSFCSLVVSFILIITLLALPSALHPVQGQGVRIRRR
jgi:mRNA deadenylase 3'-5' endonuclease subunit Ccr4